MAENKLKYLEKEVKGLAAPSIFRLTEGLPKHELKMIEKEAIECEEALLYEIRLLEESVGIKNSEECEKSSPKEPPNTDSRFGSLALGGWAYDSMGGKNFHSTVDAMLMSPLTPPDRFFTLSAVLGRLRAPLRIPSPPNKVSTGPPVLKKARSISERRKSTTKKNNSGGSGSNNSNNSSCNDANSTNENTQDGGMMSEKQQLKEIEQQKKAIEKQNAILALQSNPVYTMTVEQPQLLALWKRISSHRTAAVFRKPVNPRDAPGYEDRILFPIDLSLIKKMISAGVIKSYSELHRNIGLICHNCVKFNGRESDYGFITRDFESYVDDSIVSAVGAVNINVKSTPATASTPVPSNIAVNKINKADNDTQRTEKQNVSKASENN